MSIEIAHHEYNINRLVVLSGFSVVYRHNTAEEDPTTEFFNPNKLSADGKISLATNAFSNDGSWFAYGLSTSGSDWVEVKVRNTETFKDGPDLLKEVKFSPLAWTSDNKGFFYCVNIKKLPCRFLFHLKVSKYFIFTALPWSKNRWQIKCRERKSKIVLSRCR